MSNPDYSYGKIFVNADREEVRLSLETLFNGQPGSKIWNVAGVEIEVRGNSDVGTADDFIGWPTFVEVVAESSATLDESILDVARRVDRDLAPRFGPVVVASDYEHLV